MNNQGRKQILLAVFWAVICMPALCRADTDGLDTVKIEYSEWLKSLLLFFHDEVLDDEVKSFIDYEFKSEVQDNAYVYLWGINLVSPDPYADGLKLVHEVNAANANYKHEWEPYDDSFMDGYVYISIEHEDFFCAFPEPQCVDNIITTSTKRLAAARSNALILRRYNQFFKHSNFHPLNRVYFETPIPNYRFLTYGNQLALIAAVEHLDRGELDTFFGLVNDNLNQIRIKLAQAETLISKMVLLSQLEWNTKVLSQLMQSKRIDPSDQRLSEMLRPLTPAEKDLTAAMTYDLSNWMHLQQLFFKNPHYLFKPSKKRLGSSVLSLLMPLAIKSNLTLNIMYHQSIKPTLAFTTSEQQVFQKGFKKFNAKAQYPPLRGFISTKLASAMTDHMNSYLLYPARLHAYNKGLHLLRAFHTLGSWEFVVDSVKSSTEKNQTQRPPFIEGDQICYPGLMKETENYRCIRIRD